MSSGSNIFDRRLLRVRQRRARRLTPATFLLDRVAAELGERLSAVLRKFDVAVDLGTPSDAVRRVLAANKNISTVVAAGLDGDDNGLHVTIDEEALPFAWVRTPKSWARARTACSGRPPLLQRIRCTRAVSC